MTHGEVHERQLGLAVLCLLVLVRLAGALMRPLRVAMAAHVHLRKRAHIAHPGHLDCEVTQEVDNLQRLVADTQHEHEWSDER